MSPCSRWHLRAILLIASAVMGLLATSTPVLADPGFPPVAASAGGDSEPMAVLQRAKMWHIAHDTDAELSQYADDAVISISPPPEPPGKAGYSGKAEVRQYLDWSRQETAASHEQLCCSTVVEQGDTVTMTSRMTSDVLRQEGYGWVPVVDAFVAQNGLIRRYSMTIDLSPPAAAEPASPLPDARLPLAALAGSVTVGLAVVWVVRKLVAA